MMPETNPRWKLAQETLGMTATPNRTEAERIAKRFSGIPVDPEKLLRALMSFTLRVQQAQRERDAGIAQDHALGQNPSGSVGGIVCEASRAIATAIRNAGEGGR